MKPGWSPWRLLRWGGKIRAEVAMVQFHQRWTSSQIIREGSWSQWCGDKYLSWDTLLSDRHVTLVWIDTTVESQNSLLKWISKNKQWFNHIENIYLNTVPSLRKFLPSSLFLNSIITFFYHNLNVLRLCIRKIKHNFGSKKCSTLRK